MRLAILGTGIVGETLAGKLVALGHEVRMGARDAANEKAAAWVAGAGDRASHGTFADAAGFGELVVNATAGTVSLEVLAAARPEDLDGKVLLDVANPLDFSGGFPPRLSVVNEDSLAEAIQRAYPQALVVKSLNTVAASVMVDPGLVPGVHNLFLSGNDADAKATVRALLGEFGWPAGRVLDLGDITTARGTEMYLALWVRLFGALGTPNLNVAVTVAT